PMGDGDGLGLCGRRIPAGDRGGEADDEPNSRKRSSLWHDVFLFYWSVFGFLRSRVRLPNWNGLLFLVAVGQAMTSFESMYGGKAHQVVHVREREDGAAPS